MPAVASVVVASGAAAVRDDNVPVSISQQERAADLARPGFEQLGDLADGVLASAVEFAPGETSTSL